MEHGEWLPWLKQFSLSDRSAQKYMKAADFAAKNELGSDLKLRPSALYLLSEDSYWEGRLFRQEATEAVLTAAREERVGLNRAKEIIDRTIADRQKEKARQDAQAIAMADDMAVAKDDAEANGESWEEGKDEWIERWKDLNWGEDQEAKFETERNEQLARNGQAATDANLGCEPVVNAGAEFDQVGQSSRSPRAGSSKDYAVTKFSDNVLELFRKIRKQKVERFAKTGVPAVHLVKLGTFLIDLAALIEPHVAASEPTPLLHKRQRNHARAICRAHESKIRRTRCGRRWLGATVTRDSYQFSGGRLQRRFA